MPILQSTRARYRRSDTFLSRLASHFLPTNISYSLFKPSLIDAIEVAVNNVVNYEFSSSVGTHSWPKGSGYLADQLRRAIASVVLNISEGYGRGTLQERRRFFDIATGSAFEVASIFDIAIAQNFESFQRGQSIKSKMFLLAKMLSRI